MGTFDTVALKRSRPEHVPHSGNRIERLVRRIDGLQQGSRPVGFIVGVLKKYGDDRGGQLAALVAFSAYLAFFPLMLVLVTGTRRDELVQGAPRYDPHLSLAIMRPYWAQPLDRESAASGKRPVDAAAGHGYSANLLPEACDLGTGPPVPLLSC